MLTLSLVSLVNGVKCGVLKGLDVGQARALVQVKVADAMGKS